MRAEVYPYAAQQGSEWVGILDGKPFAGYEGIVGSSLIVSTDGTRLAYIAKKGKLLVVVDGKPDPIYEQLGDGSLLFRPDGRHVAYVAQIGGKRSVAVDGQPGPTYDGIMAGSPVFSPDSQHLAYEAVQGDKGLVVVDGKSPRSSAVKVSRLGWALWRSSRPSIRSSRCAA